MRTVFEIVISFLLFRLCGTEQSAFPDMFYLKERDLEKNEGKYSIM
jgi:hypothetical protein